MHRLPRARIVERVGFLLERARGRRVIHLGFVDEERMEEKIEQGGWLHAQLAGVAGDLVGIDASAGGVDSASREGYDAYLADLENAAEVDALGIEPADLVLAAEVVEHLANPGRMLEAVRPLLRKHGELIVTTPNAHSLTNVLAGFAGYELVNSDHVGWQSWWTCRALLGRHGFRVSEIAYYPFPTVEIGSAIPRGHRTRARFFNAYLGAVRPLYSVRPSLADGLILVAHHS